MGKEKVWLIVRRLSRVAATFFAVFVLSSCAIRIGPASVPGVDSTAITATAGATGLAPSSATGGPLPAPSTSQPAAYTPDRLVQYALELINNDRADSHTGIGPVTLGTNRAAQKHAEDMLAGFFLSHWGTDGLKPYMRYTLEGGINYEMENSAYAGWYDKADNPDSYVLLDVKNELQELEYKMMYDDAGSDWGHRDNILNPWHKRVNIGIAYDKHRLAFVQQFEGEYVQFTQAPTLVQQTLMMAGTLALGRVDAVAVYYDRTPEPMAQDQLVNGPHSYGLGNRVANVVSPPPQGYTYTNLPADALIATVWIADGKGGFTIAVDLGSVMKQHGAGVYTFVIVNKAPGAQPLSMTNYSLFVQ